jgi:hypothetical protein
MPCEASAAEYGLGATEQAPPVVLKPSFQRSTV